MTEDFDKPPTLSAFFEDTATQTQRYSDYTPHIYSDIHCDIQAFANQARKLGDSSLELESAAQAEDFFNLSHLENKDDF